MTPIKVQVDLSRYMVNEAVSNSNFAPAMETIKTYLKKNNVFTHDDMRDVTVGGTKYYGYYTFSIKNNTGAYFLWRMSDNSAEVTRVIFTKDGQKAYADLTVGGRTDFEFGCTVNGISLVKLLPFVVGVLNKKIAMNEKPVRKWFVNNNLYESLKQIEGSPIYESDDINDIRRRINNLSTKIGEWRRKGKDVSELEAEREQLCRMRDEMALQISRGETVDVMGDMNEIEDQEDEFQRRATPEERFNDMEHYINMVLKGLQPSVLICGAPGVGKTYRVMQKVKASGRRYKVIKGKTTPLAFYMDLFEYHHDGDILVCDDADDVLTDETITNLIKAATDSSDERIVSYGTSKPPIMPMEQFEALSPEDQALCQLTEFHGGTIVFYPKSFETKGSMIIITNRSAGQIDTAVRNRGLVCDLAFTVEECLGLIKDIMPAIMPGKLSSEAKIKALEYLQALASAKSKMEISIRSFTTVAKVYEDVDDEGQAERMIREQMRLQSLRGGRKY